MEVIELENGMLMCADVLDGLKTLDDNSIDSIVTDPPYGIAFMNKKWDYDVPKTEVWREALRVLKPGGHALVACGTRTQHRMVCNIEDAGFEIRDVITWHYGSGFPKSLDVSKAIDKHLGVERNKQKLSVENVGNFKNRSDTRPFIEKAMEIGYHETDDKNPVSDEAKQWNGWGTALKPATEFWTLCRKPLSEKTVAQNVLKWGTGGINIDGGRIDGVFESGWSKSGSKASENIAMSGKNYERQPKPDNPEGRFPANVIFDELTSQELDEQSGTLTSGKVGKDGFKGKYKAHIYGKYANNVINPKTVKGDSGGASRFFYCAKASKSERNKGLEDAGFKKEIGHNRFDKCKNCGGTILQNQDRPSACKCKNSERANNEIVGNHHPTVKPVSLMQYLVRLIAPSRSICLDLYNGSGTTGIACKLEDIFYIGIDNEMEYCKISEYRIKAWQK